VDFEIRRLLHDEDAVLAAEGVRNAFRRLCVVAPRAIEAGLPDGTRREKVQGACRLQSQERPATPVCMRGLQPRLIVTGPAAGAPETRFWNWRRQHWTENVLQRAKRNIHR